MAFNLSFPEWLLVLLYFGLLETWSTPSSNKFHKASVVATLWTDVLEDETAFQRQEKCQKMSVSEQNNFEHVNMRAHKWCWRDKMQDLSFSSEQYAPVDFGASRINSNYHRNNSSLNKSVTDSSSTVNWFTVLHRVWSNRWGSSAK